MTVRDGRNPADLPPAIEARADGQVWGLVWDRTPPTTTLANKR